MLAIASWVGIALWIGHSIEEAIADGFARSCSDSAWHQPEDTADPWDTADTGDTADTELWPVDTAPDTGRDTAPSDSGDTGVVDTGETGAPVHTADTGTPVDTGDTAP